MLQKNRGTLHSIFLLTENAVGGVAISFGRSFCGSWTKALSLRVLGLADTASEFNRAKIWKVGILFVSLRNL